MKPKNIIFTFLICILSLSTQNLSAAAQYKEAYVKKTPLYKAAKKGNEKKVKKLLKEGANPNLLIQLRDHYTSSALQIAIEKNNIAIVEILLTAGANPNLLHHYEPPLHRAVGGDNIVIVKLLLTAGADPNLQDLNGDTSLHLFVIQGDRNIVKTLLEHGASPLVINNDKNGNLPLLLTLY